MDELNFLIKPSSHLCNLNCTYCFYKRVESLYPGRDSIMTVETAEAFIRQTLELGAGRNLFGWQGGEPTLAGLDFYRAVVEIQDRYLRPGQTAMNSLQTNGILLDETWAEFLRRHNFLVGLSLDGPMEIHDSQRLTYGGRGTYETVMEKVRLLKEHGVEFNILTLLTAANVHQPERLYRFFRRHRLDWLQFIPCLEWDPDTGAKQAYSIEGIELGEFYCRLFDLWLKDGFPRVSIRLFEDVLIYLLDGVLTSCTWQQRCDSYLLVEHNGDCYPCDFFVYPEWKLGNIINDSLLSIINNPLRSKFAAIKSQPTVECSRCRYVEFCHGDCIKFRSDRAGRFEGLSHFCAAWKLLFEHIENHPQNIREMATKAREAFAKSQMKKPGRNDPCPCGSGKKYKKCCLNKR